MSEEKKIFPATRKVHWPSGPVDCCDKHAAQLDAMHNFLGACTPLVHTRVKEGATCSNCENEEISDE